MAPLECNTRERELGLEVFYTSTPGVGGRLRADPEDFQVREISRYPERSDEGRFTVARVTATNWETNRLIRQLSRALRISRRKVGFAGTKDKRAVTTQLMSFQTSPEEVGSLDIHQVDIDQIYPSRREITIGDLVGNSFVIRVRDCLFHGRELEDLSDQVTASLKELGGFPNFFGVQRFGALRPVTHLVGKKIIQGDFEGAVMTYCANPVEEEAPEAREARRELGDTGDFKAALSTFPRRLTFERTVVEHLAEHPGDFPGALGRLPNNLQMMFVHAYQSYLFNRILSERMRRGLPLNRPVEGDVVLPVGRDDLPEHDSHIPVTGENMDLVWKQLRDGRAVIGGLVFGSESEFAGGEMGEIERSVVESEGIQRRDFLVPDMPRASSKGNRRELVGRFSELEHRVEGDRLDIRFSLTKGCYATSLLREYMKADTMDY
ncbi:MAG: tRNA pseudouridine(13) synthase TruD [Methanomassiliicoccales archaeon]